MVHEFRPSLKTIRNNTSVQRLAKLDQQCYAPFEDMYSLLSILQHSQNGTAFL
jgi:hypothetical protein